MNLRRYLLSLPERVVRSAVGFGAGTLREAGELAIPAGVRRSQLYQNLVDTTLRVLIEQVGGMDDPSRTEEQLAEDFLLRRSAGNALELLGLVAFRASPVWVLALLADLCGAGRQLIPEIADALKKEGLLDPDCRFTTVDQVLDGLERTSSRLAAVVNAPPLDVPSLRAEWQALRTSAAAIAPGSLPSKETIAGLWSGLTIEAERQHRSVFEMSSMLAVSAAGALPDTLRWVSSSARLAASRTGQLFAAALLDHYRQTLLRVGEIGFARYAARQLRPYVRAAAAQFAPGRRTLTERLLDRWR